MPVPESHVQGDPGCPKLIDKRAQSSSQPKLSFLVLSSGDHRPLDLHIFHPRGLFVRLTALQLIGFLFPL
jgi:hypothetical protein